MDGWMGGQVGGWMDGQRDINGKYSEENTYLHENDLLLHTTIWLDLTIIMLTKNIKHKRAGLPDTTYIKLKTRQS